MKKLPAQAEALFAEALALPAAERGTFLAKACGPDVDLLAHLVALVAAHEESDSILAAPAPACDAMLEERPGELVGRYKLLEKLGEGGCGTVWAAEQREPVKRRVALKIIKLGMDTKQIVARFEAERQALALMDHPNIAKMLDAAAARAGELFRMLGTPPELKRHLLSDDPHAVPNDTIARELGPWFDRYLGPVK